MEYFEFRKTILFHDIYTNIHNLKVMVTSLEGILDSHISDLSKISPSIPIDDSSHNAIIKHQFFKYTFPETFWKTTFLQAYFILESSLDKICIEIQLKKNLTLSLTDISGSGIIRSSTYLKKVAGIRKPFESHHWRHFKSYNKIRNKLVHTDGNFDKTDKDLFKLIKTFLNTLGHLDADLYNKLLFRKEFALNFLEFVEINFKNIESELD